jgi:hypothetical protein
MASLWWLEEPDQTEPKVKINSELLFFHHHLLLFFSVGGYNTIVIRQLG